MLVFRHGIRLFNSSFYTIIIVSFYNLVAPASLPFIVTDPFRLHYQLYIVVVSLGKTLHWSL
jgi:hypothetical protein